MVLAELVGSAAIGATGIWSYNRKNFMYDREMRQHQELQIIAMKLRQTDLWREDIRDMVGLTEKKMDSYMIVNALQLGFTVGLFAEGRLEPGTPEWLLWLYMLSLGGAFMMLLVSVWFAMHASVVAQSHATRLLTQLVRPPIPSWEQLEATRTYGHAFEGIPAASMMRVPLLQTISEGEHAGVGGLAGHHTEPAGSSAADPWGLERRGDDIYELQRRPIADNRHTRLLREAMKHWQAYDAFARVSMTLGTILLCFALSYYVLGYVLVQDGSPWAAWIAVSIFMGIATTILRLDLSLTFTEKCIAHFLLVGGPVVAAVAAAEWAMYKSDTEAVALAVTPAAYVLHAAFMMDFLRLCHVVRQPGGSLLPTSFRSVLYVDVFGWLVQRQPDRARGPMAGARGRGSYQAVMADVPAEDLEEESEEEAGEQAKGAPRRSQQVQRMSSLLQTFNKDAVRGHLDDSEQLQVREMSERLQEVSPSPWPQLDMASSGLASECCASKCSAPEWVRLSTFSDYGQKVPYYVNVNSGEVSHEPPAGAAAPAGEAALPPSLSFTAEQMDALVTPRASAAQPQPEPEGSPTCYSPSQNGTPAAATWSSGGSSSSSSANGRPAASAPGSAQEEAPPEHQRSCKRQQTRLAVTHSQTFPRNTLRASAPTALRPDDVDGVLHGPDDPHGGLWAREEAAKQLQADLEDSEARSRHGRGAPLLGVGPAGVIPEASEDAFAPRSFAPVAGEGHEAGAGPETGHDAFVPGQLPWYVFRSGALLLAGLWALGALWSVAQFLQIPDIPDKVLPESVSISGEKVNGPEWLSVAPKEAPPLPEGRQIGVQWPNERFQPTGISCDHQGRHFAFSDDFQLYYAQLSRAAAGPAPRLEDLRPAPLCGSLEGEAVQDVAVLCARAACSVLVLHDRGRQLSECDLLGSGRAPAALGAAPTLPAAGRLLAAEAREEGGGAGEAGQAADEGTWRIADRWLQDPGLEGSHEKVVSVAINSNCNGSSAPGAGAQGQSAMLPGDQRDSCVVVGTNYNRVVKLRQHIRQDRVLVPSGALWNARGAMWMHYSKLDGVSSSNLHILPRSYVLVLRDGMRSVHAIDIQNARSLGMWRLPELPGRNWSGLAGGAEHLYIMSLSQSGKAVQLWQFPLPRELRAR